MSLMDDIKAAVAPGQASPNVNLDDIFEKWDKKYREQGLLPTGFETLEYEVGRSDNRQTKTIQVPIYKEAQQAATDLYIEEQIAAGKLKRVEDEDEDDVPEAKIYQGDYQSKFAEGGEGYTNPYLDEQEALKNIPTDFPGQNALQGFADLKSTPIPELQINPSVSAPVTEALPVNTTYNNSAAINNIVGGLSSVTAPIEVPGLGTISGSGAVTPPSLGMSPNFPAINKPPGATKAVTPAPIAEPYDGLNKTYPAQTSSSGYNFGVMGAPDAPPPAAQPPAATEGDFRAGLLTGLMSRRKQGDGPTPEQKQPESLEESQRQRLDAEMVTRQNMARAGQTADIRLGIQNGRTASGLDAFKRRFKIGQQSPSTNLMINA